MRSRRASPVLIAVSLLATLALVPAPATAQAEEEPGRRLSPIGIAKAWVGDAYVKVTYGRPYMRDRAIFGPDTTHLVPFGRIWRTGANEATEVTITGPLRVDGTRLEAGTYSIFTEPGETRWRVHMSPQLGLDGTGELDPETGEFTPDVWDPDRDVAVFEVPVHALDQTVDPLTLELESTDAGAELVLQWERTEVRIPFVRPTS